VQKSWLTACTAAETFTHQLIVSDISSIVRTQLEAGAALDSSEFCSPTGNPKFTIIVGVANNGADIEVGVIQRNCQAQFVVRMYRVGITTANGRTKQVFELRNGAQVALTGRLVKAEELLDSSKGLVFNDCLNIKCCLTFSPINDCRVVDVNPCGQPGRNYIRGPDGSCLRNLLTDVTISAGGRQFPAHRVVLASQSSVFDAILQTPDGNVALDDIGATVVEEILNFLYTGKAPNIASLSEELRDAAVRFNIVKLQAAFENRVLPSESTSTSTNVSVGLISTAAVDPTWPSELYTHQLAGKSTVKSVTRSFMYHNMTSSLSRARHNMKLQKFPVIPLIDPIDNEAPDFTLEFSAVSGWCDIEPACCCAWMYARPLQGRYCRQRWTTEIRRGENRPRSFNGRV